MVTSTFKQFVPVFEAVQQEKVTESRISRVIALLPTSIHSRINQYHPARRSKSLSNLPLANGQQDWEMEKRPASASDSVALVKASGSDLALQGACIRSSSSTFEVTERLGSGVHNQFTVQGVNLVNASVGGAASATPADRAFERKVLLDGLTYLLRGLPQDLTAQEVEQIQAALPPDVAANNGQGPQPRRLTNGPAQTQDRSMLQYLTQKAVFQAVFLFCLLLPYVLCFLKLLARVERRHKVSERVITQGRDIAVSMGRQGILVIDAVGGWNDGKAGRILKESVIWTVDSIAQGVRDGVGEGLEAATSAPVQ